MPATADTRSICHHSFTFEHLQLLLAHRLLLLVAVLDHECDMDIWAVLLATFAFRGAHR